MEFQRVTRDIGPYRYLSMDGVTASPYLVEGPPCYVFEEGQGERWVISMAPGGGRGLDTPEPRRAQRVR